MADRLTMFVERRRARRHRLSFPIRHRPVGQMSGEADDFLLEYGRDFSSSGIFLETSHPLAVGTKLELVFRLPPELSEGQKAQHVKVLGEVVWTSTGDETTGPGGSGMGVHFVDADEDCLKLLEKIVKKIAVFPEGSAPEPH